MPRPPNTDRFGYKLIPNVDPPKGGDSVSVTHINNPADFKLIPVKFRPQLVKMQRNMRSFYVAVSMTSDMKRSIKFNY